MSKSLPSELSDMIQTFFPLDEKTIIGHKCGLCGGFNPKLCYRCRITELETDNDNLRKQLKMGTTSLLLSHKDQLIMTNVIIQRTNYVIIEEPIDSESESSSDYESWYSEWCSSRVYFITITFDPSKFGIDNDSEQERVYILHKLEKAINKIYIKRYYGCFEYQKNGTIHAHLVVDVGIASPHDIRKHLKPYFTNNMRNLHAVQVEFPKSLSKVFRYINKHENGKQWYYRVSDSSYLDQ